MANGVIETVKEVLGNVDVKGCDLGRKMILVSRGFTDLYNLFSDVGVMNASVDELFCNFLSQEEFVQFEDILKNIHLCSIIKFLGFL